VVNTGHLGAPPQSPALSKDGPEFEVWAACLPGSPNLSWDRTVGLHSAPAQLAVFNSPPVDFSSLGNKNPGGQGHGNSLLCCAWAKPGLGFGESEKVSKGTKERPGGPGQGMGHPEEAMDGGVGPVTGAGPLSKRIWLECSRGHRRLPVWAGGRQGESGKYIGPARASTAAGTCVLTQVFI
jgi:hypothetical protein